jgi:hypothetical protein
MYRYDTDLELNRARGKEPVAKLVATATPAEPRMQTNLIKGGGKGFQGVKARKLSKTRLAERAAATIRGSRPEKITLTGSQRLGWWTLIGLNVIGDIIDVVGLFFGPGTVVTVVADVILLAINLVFIGSNPKTKKLIKGSPYKWILKRIGIDQVPFLEVVYFRSWGVIKLYKQRKKAAEEGLKQEELNTIG